MEEKGREAELEREKASNDNSGGETEKKPDKKSKLCKLVKNDYLKKHFDEYQALVERPMYICRKCGRAAKDKKSLCKPALIDKQKK